MSSARSACELLVSHLKEKFDYVVIDTPPVGPVIDPAIVARLADKTIFVVQWGVNAARAGPELRTAIVES